MWPLFKKLKPSLSCIGKSILDDLSKYPREEWKIKWVGSCNARISHPKIKYIIYASLLDDEWSCVKILTPNDELLNEKILNSDDDVLNTFDKYSIIKKVEQLIEQRSEINKENFKNREKQMLREYFPNCL